MSESVTKPARVATKPARVQVDPATIDEANDRPPQTGTVFNIWYQKWAGGDKNDSLYGQQKADHRCVVARDQGYTKADSIKGAFFCLYFARGMCVNGKKCEFLHRLPTQFDFFAPNVDCFGRERFADYRDDMGGVGSFMKHNRTLYIGRIGSGDLVEEAVSRHFSEWGAIERIRVLADRGIAFVTYVNEVNAQFAKEAMAHQSLDSNEVLNVRWAIDDPNPKSQAREKRRIQEMAVDTIRQLLPEGFLKQIEGGDSLKRQRVAETFGLEGYEPPDELWFNQSETSINPESEGRKKIEAKIEAEDEAKSKPEEAKSESEEVKNESEADPLLRTLTPKELQLLRPKAEPKAEKSKPKSKPKAQAVVDYSDSE